MKIHKPNYVPENNMTDKPMTLEERMGEEVEYDPLTGTLKKKLQPLTEVDTPGSEYWTKHGQPRRPQEFTDIDEKYWWMENTN